MAYADLDSLAQDEKFIQKLTFALTEKAKDVYVGDNTLAGLDGATVAYVGPRTVDFRKAAEEISALILTVNPNLDLNSTDAEIDTAVGQVWTAFGKILQKRGLITVV
jgi:hypothetical protein